MPKAPLSVTPANPWVKILYPGTFTSLSGNKITFTEADVTNKAAALQAQLATGYKPPTVVGHPKTTSPRVASVIGSKLEKGELYAQVDELTPEFAESCRKGEYKYQSPSFYPNGGLRHLGILGGWNPAMKEQGELDFGEFGAGEFAEPDAAAGGSAEDLLSFAETADWGSVVGGWLNRLVWRLKDLGGLLRNQREAMIAKDGVEAADKVYPTYAIENLEGLEIPYDINPSTSSQAAASFGEPAPVPTPATPPVTPAPASVPVVQEPTEREKELLRQLEEANNRLAEAGKKATSDAFGERLAKAEDEGRLSPVVREKFQDLFGRLQGHASENDLAFGEGDPIPQGLAELVDSLPKIIEFGEGPTRTTPTTEVNPLLATVERMANAAKESR